MSNFKRETPVLAMVTLGLAGLFTFGEASALTGQQHSVSPTGVCQPTTPLNIGGLRFRPLGIYNASANDLYITCSIPTDYRTDESLDEGAGRYSLYIYLDAINNNATDRSIECIVIPGTRLFGSTSYPLSFNVTGGGASNETGGGYYQRGTYGSFNMTCLLPSKVELSQIYLYEYDFDNQF